MSLRVVNLGLPKSGTTTLATALARAGLKVADHRVRRGSSPDPSIAGSFVARQVYEGYFQTGDPLARLAGYDALCEISVLTPRLCLWPQTDYGVIAAMRGAHPNLRFVASMRDPRAMSDSMLRWSDLGSHRLPRGAIPGLPAGFGETSRERAQWIAAHHDFLRTIFAGDDRFLAYDTADPDAAQKIGAHLCLDLPWWGKANENRATPARGAA